ncbi:fluoride efflux transporter CrcB [Nocardioides insulae]|uniref:fluoride efflux transporter CrcB n=1 Tax=Nocardioides insulae TaxID=394734 RepID=UPI0003FE3047|nr:fluoride efflux transporter CrcB [Nocardioides insulae]
MTVLLVLAGGAVGAPARWAVDRWVQARHGTGLPWGVFVVNVLGSLILGLAAGAAAGGALAGWVLTLVGTGFCGALTTYSTFAYETVLLAERRAWAQAVLNVALSLAVGLAACSSGWWVGLTLADLG